MFLINFFNKFEFYILHEMVNAALQCFYFDIGDTTPKDQKITILNKIKKSFEFDSKLYFTKEEFDIVKECVKETLKYLDEDEFHTWLGAEPDEVYKVRDLIMSIEISK